MHRKRGAGRFSSNDQKRRNFVTEANDVPLDAESAMSESNEHRYHRAKENEIMDRRYGFETFNGPGERFGWLVNMHPTDILDESKKLVSAVDFYFLQSDGSRFKVSRVFRPYFFVSVGGDRGVETEVTTFISRKYAGRIASIEHVEKEDLDMPNHLIGVKARYLKLSFHSVDELVGVRKEISARVKANTEIASLKSTYTEMLGEHFQDSNDASTSSEHQKFKSGGKATDSLDYLTDIREYDVPYLMRVSIDLGIFAAHWYTVKCRPSQPPEFIRTEETVAWPEPVVLAYDIETTKLPLKFPDVSVDQIMMISYMIDGVGFLICNHEIIAEEIQDFEFTPLPEFPGHFKVSNVPNEEAVIQHFFGHILRVKPTVMVTYNGDNFDWPFVEARAAVYNIKMTEEIGFRREKSGPSVGRDANAGDYLSRAAIHMDCYRWVKRDSYLPVGAQGLKAVAKAKLKYDPVELDPELMCRMAREEPHTLANYSVSDAVATYYLYMKYVHPFVFALCTILPLNPDDVLRKGSGTLCEALLMVQAYEANVVYPHKQSGGSSNDRSQGILAYSGNNYNFTDDNRLIDSETYVGGHVESLEAGVFRADIPVRFRLVPAACEKLRADARRCIKRAISDELDAKDPSVVDNLLVKEDFEKVCKEVENSLSQLGSMPNRVECPVIVHLDVGAMYPNIILTNRLQPSAVAADADKHCSNCHFYKPGVACQRFMSWQWRGELWTASRAEVYRVQAQLAQERFPTKSGTTGQTYNRAFHQLSKEEQAAVEKKRLTDFCRRAYKRIHTTRTEERVGMICQRENSFYVDTVRNFRDRRYKFKGLTKVWKRKFDAATAAIKAGTGDPSVVKEAGSLLVLYDSLQLAHKCILNSFYGYVMRRGARWHSMEMAGIVCHTGANIITRARELVEQVGRTLELDTDGIWCMLPASFPQNLSFLLVNGKRVSTSYPGAVLNQMVQDLFTNEQYHELVNPSSLSYAVRSENSIFFEIDGPYRAMMLPAAKEEGKRLKKRYAVFNFDGSLAELKGFEVKRNGELQLIKIFQSSVFEAFLRGNTLTEVYAAVANVANHWLDVLFSHGSGMPDSELFDLISENRSMSRKLSDYGDQKSTSISTAKRLAEFLGDAIVKETRLACRFIIARQPEQAPVTERAIPLAIFQAEPSVKRHFLRKWLKEPSVSADVDLRSILDWNYYIERLGSAIKKIITIPAALQQVANPVPRITHPDWLLKRLAEKNDTCRQRKLTDMFSPMDIEEAGLAAKQAMSPHSGLLPRCTKKRPSEMPKSPSGPPLPWRSVLGNPPPVLEDVGTAAWLDFHRKKWALQAERRKWLVSQRIASGDGFDDGVLLTGGPLAKRSKGLGGFLTRTRAALTSTIWQIVEVVPNASQPGRYTLWVFVHSPFDTTDGSSTGQLHSIPLEVSRRFYVNIRAAKPQESGTFYRKVSTASTSGANDDETITTSNYSLPRSHPVYHLYEYNVPEDVYTAHMSDIAADLVQPEVEGVYELNVPSLFRILTRLGCLCAVNRKKRRQAGLEEASGGSGADVGESFQLDQLEFRSLAQHAYLEKKSCLRKMFLFHYQGTSPSLTAAYSRKEASRQMYLLVVPWTQRAYICVVDTARVNQLPNLESLYSKQFTRFHPDAASTTGLPASLAFETRVETEPVVARRVVQRWITSANHQERSRDAPESASTAPVIMLLHSSATTGDFPQTSSGHDAPWAIGRQIVGRRRSPQLTALAEMPVVPLGGTDDDKGEDDGGAADAYSILNWQRTLVKRGIKFFLQSEARFENQLELSRYLHVPVGNVPVTDTPFHISSNRLSSVDSKGAAIPLSIAAPICTTEFGCDLFYARHLAKQNHILWASGTDRPDFGGKEVDDQRMMLEMEEASVVEINHRGCYRHVCVDLELSNLAVNTLLVASRIPELEGASALTFDRLIPAQQSIDEQLSHGVNLGAQITHYDETAACSAAFRVLRTMVVGWVKDVTQYQNALADEQVIYFYHWLRSSSSLLYDPALRRTLQKLMKKVFLKLVDELNQTHGLDVVFASFSRLVLCTHRLEVADALSRADGLTRMLRTKPLFVHLDLQYTQGWHQILWYDSANYAGIKLSREGGRLPGQSRVVSSSGSRDALVVSIRVFNCPTLLLCQPIDLERLDSQAKDSQSEGEDALDVDMWWHIARYLPETRGLRAKFQALIAGYLLASRKATVAEAKRLGECGITLSQPRPARSVADGGESRDENAPPPAAAVGGAVTDVTLAPGVLDFLDRLVREQLAPELYAFVQRLKLKAGAWCPTRDHSTTSPYTSAEIVAYLDEKSVLPMEDEGSVPSTPLLPPHPAQWSAAALTPINDFVKAICQVFSLDGCISRQIGDMQRDLFRLIGVGEFSSGAVWIPPHEFSTTSSSKGSIGGGRSNSLLVHLPEVTCSTCNYIRDLDVCRDRHLAFVGDVWSLLCPHCGTAYSKGYLEAGLLSQVEQITMQFMLQDLRCPKCVTGGGIQESCLAKGGSLGRCADCATQLELTVHGGGGGCLSHRLAVYSSIGRFFNLSALQHTADWMLLHRAQN